MMKNPFWKAYALSAMAQGFIAKRAGLSRPTVANIIADKDEIAASAKYSAMVAVAAALGYRLVITLEPINGDGDAA